MAPVAPSLQLQSPSSRSGGGHGDGQSTTHESSTRVVNLRDKTDVVGDDVATAPNAEAQALAVHAIVGIAEAARVYQQVHDVQTFLRAKQQEAARLDSSRHVLETELKAVAQEHAALRVAENCFLEKLAIAMQLAPGGEWPHRFVGCSGRKASLDIASLASNHSGRRPSAESSQISCSHSVEPATVVMHHIETQTSACVETHTPRCVETQTPRCVETQTPRWSISSADSTSHAKAIAGTRTKMPTGHDRHDERRSSASAVPATAEVTIGRPTTMVGAKIQDRMDHEVLSRASSKDTTSIPNLTITRSAASRNQIPRGQVEQDTAVRMPSSWAGGRLNFGASNQTFHIAGGPIPVEQDFQTHLRGMVTNARPQFTAGTAAFEMLEGQVEQQVVTQKVPSDASKNVFFANRVTSPTLGLEHIIDESGTRSDCHSPSEQSPPSTGAGRTPKSSGAWPIITDGQSVDPVGAAQTVVPPDIRRARVTVNPVVVEHELPTCVAADSEQDSESTTSVEPPNRAVQLAATSVASGLSLRGKDQAALPRSPSLGNEDVEAWIRNSEFDVLEDVVSGGSASVPAGSVIAGPPSLTSWLHNLGAGLQAGAKQPVSGTRRRTEITALGLAPPTVGHMRQQQRLTVADMSHLPDPLWTDRLVVDSSSEDSSTRGAATPRASPSTGGGWRREVPVEVVQHAMTPRAANGQNPVQTPRVHRSASVSTPSFIQASPLSSSASGSSCFVDNFGSCRVPSAANAPNRNLVAGLQGPF